MRGGITARWLRNSLLIIILLLAVAEGLFVYLYNTACYNSVRQSMLQRFSSMTGQLQVYSGGTEAAAQARRQALRRMTEQFGEKEKYEFMLLDAQGHVLASSSGTKAEGITVETDFSAAQESAEGTGVASYATARGERVMAVCILVPYAAQDVAALRLVTSLTLVEAQMRMVLVNSLLVCGVVLLVAVLSGVFFVQGIVVPLAQVEIAAAAITHGDLTVRLPVNGNEGDEVNRLRASINRMAEGLTETERMKNEFISSVSHELRTPLTAIKGWVETMQAIDDPQDENYRKGLAVIGNEADRLYAMVEELLDFSRLQSGHIALNCSPLDLVAEVTDAVLFFEARMQAEGLVLRYEEPPEPIPVYADPDRLRQVFVNIMDNAIKYSAFGGQITVKVWAGKSRAFVEVLDQGRGIAPEDLQNVKTKFFKGKNAVRGSGIGLALVDEIMTAFDGSVDLNSTLGRGTVVTLALPLYHPRRDGA